MEAITTSGDNWTNDELAMAFPMRVNGFSPAEISRVLTRSGYNRTPKQVGQKIRCNPDTGKVWIIHQNEGR